MDEKSGKLELEESLDDFMAMYAAGNATTSTALFWSLGQISRNPLVMDTLVEEVC
jgi:cytochrome P450